MGSFAQDVVPVEKYSIATNSFGSNWFVQAGLGLECTGILPRERGHDLSEESFQEVPQQSGNISLALGKWSTPGIGLRTKISGILGKEGGCRLEPGYQRGQWQ